MKLNPLLPLLTAVVICGVAAIGATAASPAQKPVKVKGTQTVVDEAKGIFQMHGSLVGRWVVTSFELHYADGSELAISGTERFRGCHDTNADGSCGAAEPSGTLRFTFVYWATLDPKTEQLVRGQCVHPVTGGTGAFAKAKGFLIMYDRPTATGIRTTYTGTLDYGGPKSATAAPIRSLASTSVSRSCGS
jgi:hypothetical protein